MPHKKLYSVLTILLFLMTLVSCVDEKQEQKKYTIATGGITGLYYKSGENLSLLMNKRQITHGYHFEAQLTGGSVSNIKSLMKGEHQFAFVQTDRLYQAYNGLAEWKKSGPSEKLRSLFCLHSEIVSLVVAEDSGINNIEDIKGKRINIGNTGSGLLQNTREILQACNISEKDFKASNLKMMDVLKKMKTSEIDGFFYTAGHPNVSIEDAFADKRKLKFIHLNNSSINQMIKESLYYSAGETPTHYYPASMVKEKIPAPALRACLSCSSELDNDTVYTLVKYVFENLEEFKQMHLAHQELTPKIMLENVSVPVHPGALKYYKEKGLDKHIPKAFLKD